MDRLTEALKNLLKPEEIAEVSRAVEEMIAESEKAIKADYEAKLEQAYTQVTQELQEAEATAQTGYQQAYDIIMDLEARLETQKKEAQEAMDEGFEEAFQKLVAEQKKNETLEVELYKEFDKKLREMQEFMVDKMDQFLTLQEGEIYEQAMRKVMTDPAIAEDKVVVDRIVDIVADRLSDDEFASVSSAKVEEAVRQVEDLRAQLRIVEAKNVRLSTVNNQLNEQVQEAQKLLTEGKQIERKERAAKKENASGRGKVVVERAEVIPEHGNQIVESSETSDLPTDLLILAGVEQAT